jgi:TonB family protein
VLQAKLLAFSNFRLTGRVITIVFAKMSQLSISEDIELDLLREWREPLSPSRILRAGLGSIGVHIAIGVLVMVLPWGAPMPDARETTPDLRKSVHLVAPKFLEPTQKAPNQGKVTRELDVRSLQRAPIPQAPRFRPPAPAPGYPAATAQAPVIEAPKIDVAESAPPPMSSGTSQAPPLPAPEKPKLAFESVGAAAAARSAPGPNAKVPPVKTSVSDAMRSAAKPGAGGVIVGDIGDDLSTIPSLNQMPSPGRVGSNLQLLSDPKGIDFKPYLIRVLTAVRRNWMAVIPESARMGRRGHVLIQFIIDRQGAVPKLVIAEPSGTEAFDRAAVAGISASYPFPPLPDGYKGDQIRLQLAFSYNLPTR